MFLVLAAAAGVGYFLYNDYQKKHPKTAVTPIAFAQTAQAISMSLAQDRAAGAHVDDIDSQQYTIAYVRGNLTEITNAIAVLKSRGANFTAQAFMSRAAQLMTPPTKH